MTLMIAAAVCAACVVIHILTKLFRGLRRDSHYNQNIWIHDGQRVGDEQNRPEGFMQGADMETTLRGGPRERVTSSFTFVYLRLTREDTGQCYEAYLEDQLEIGRWPDEHEAAGIHLDDPKVSKRHCMIYRRGEQLMLQDLGSTNHTYLNGCQLTGAMPLSHGDWIGIGSGNYLFECSYQR